MLKNNAISKNIFVNSTATTSGGALTVLSQFLNDIPLYDKVNTYYIFCTAQEIQKYQSDNIKIIKDAYKRKWIGRICWDNVGLEKWIKDNQIEPDLIVSLQNTGVRLGKNVKQIIYYHQSLPMYDYKWSILNNQERKLWLYKNIYPWFVRKNFHKKDILVVQSEWMKEASNRVFKISLDRIKVIKPAIQLQEFIRKEERGAEDNKTFKIIYPAFNMAFKNHKIIYEALMIIYQKRKDIYDNIKLFLTIGKKDFIQMNNVAMGNNIEFLGNLEYSKLMELYPEMDLMLFPSYLETAGLPLLEAAHFGLPIIVSDLPYARETADGYEGARFIIYDDAEAWADAIIDSYNTRKKYESFISQNHDSWSEMFELIKQQLLK